MARGLRRYATPDDLARPGAVYLRPWQLVYDPNWGGQRAHRASSLVYWSSMIRAGPQDCHAQLCQLMVVHGRRGSNQLIGLSIAKDVH